MNEQLRSELPWERMIVDLEDAFIFADCAGRIQVWNAAAEKLFGFAADEALGESLDIIIPEHLRAPHWKGYERAIERGRTAHPGQVRTTRALHKDGGKRYVEMSFSLIVDEEGKSLGSAAVARDVTESYLARQGGQ